jgi:hypothetical protein
MAIIRDNPEATGARRDPRTEETTDALGFIRRAFPTEASEDPASQMRERVWHRNLLYYIGEQWLVFDTGTGEFGRAYAGDPTIPTPVSDIIGDTVSSLLAMTMNKRFVTRVWPNSNELADKLAAELGEHLLHYLDARDDYEIEDIKELIELTRLLTGNGFARVYAADDDNWVFDSGGGRLTKGEVYVDALLPMNVRLPTEGMMLRKKPWWASQTLVSREWVEDMFGVRLPVATEEDRGNVAYQKQLLQMVAQVSSWKGAGLNMDLLHEQDRDLVVLREMEFKPCKKYPKGRLITAAEGVLCRDVAEMTIPADDKGSGGIIWDYSLVHFPYRRQMGSMWAKDAVSALISPQNIINEIDQALAVNRQSLGRPYVLTPVGLTLRRLSDRGSKMLALEYDPKTTFGQSPSVEHGTPYPQQILEERSQQRAVVQDVSGDPKNVLRGDTPGSGASGIMVDILRETAEQSHVPDVTRFYRAWNRTNRLRLRLAASVYSEQRTLKVKGAGNKVLVKTFRGGDLKGNTDVRFELDSGAASTNAGRNAFISKLVESGFWGDISQRPDVRSELLRRFGLSGIQETDNIHRKRAQMENAILVEGDREDLRTVALPDPVMRDPETGAEVVDDKGKIQTYPWPHTLDPVFEHDPDDIHLSVHDELIFSTEFRSLDPDVKSRALAHRDMHHQKLLDAMSQEIEANMLAQGLGGGPPSPASPGAASSPVGGSPAQPAPPSGGMTGGTQGGMP